MRAKKINLVLASFLALFLELTLIRWFQAHIFSLAFFSNVVLIASFLGLGLGLLISRYKQDLFKFFSLVLLGSVLITLFLRNVQVDIPVDSRLWLWSYYTGNKIQGLCLLKLSITQIICLIFVMTSVVFIIIGQKIGRLMEGFNPLFAYTLNILGSLLGVVGFGLLAFFQLPAYIWFLIAGLVVIFITFRESAFIRNILVMLAIVAIIGFFERDILWSPYYAINTRKLEDRSIAVYVNQLFHQKAVNFDLEPDVYKKYMFPYAFFNPKRVLIIGSGTGNDVWVAYRANVEHIDAVEIDPAILKIGHPQRPYENKRVSVFVDDARSFMRKTKNKYDMVVFGTLDSHAALSMGSGLRLDNYVYTRQALEETRELLSEEGVVVLLFSVGKEWLADKLLALTEFSFGRDNVRFLVADPYLFNLIIVAGPGLKKGLANNPNLAKILSPLPAKLTQVIPTDDWPYLYLMERGIPRFYGVTLLIMAVLSSMAIFGFSPIKTFRIEPLFFWLGAGFLLLETKSVTTFSLLFGSTWIVNAVVFAAILGIALLANWIVMKKRLANPKIFFSGLILSLIFLYFFPYANLLGFNFFLKILGSSLLVSLPILFSSFIFSILIRQTQDIGISLGSNLLGAVMGGLFEYSAMAWGLNALYIVALIFYLVALAFCLPRS